MTSPWQMLAGNLAVVALFVLGWAHARFWLRGVPGAPRAALFGLPCIIIDDPIAHTPLVIPRGSAPL